MSHLLLRADARRLPLADRSIHCCVTSPPYFSLRDYGVSGQLGLESTPAEYVAAMVGVFREVRRVLRDDGVLLLNIGDSYCNAGSRNNGTGLDGKRRGGMSDTDGTWSDSVGTYRDIRHSLKHQGIKHKDRIGIPHRLVFALQDDGWYWRDEIIWSKPNPMPESVQDRTTKAHEFVFLLTKSDRYFWDSEAIKEKASNRPSGNKGKSWGVNESRRREGGNGAIETMRGIPWDGEETRNRRSVWPISLVSFKGAHFATMPPKLAELCIRAGSSKKGCCPACGSPWVRVIQKRRVATRPGQDTKIQGLASLEVGNRDPQRHVTTTRTVGWESTCTCIEPVPVPCKVYDPFGGAGTTVMVAEALGRHGVMTELSAEYLGLAQKRLERPHAVATPKPTSTEPPLPLFARRRA